MEQYLSRISGPLIDRIDIQVEVSQVSYGQLTGQQRDAASKQLLGQAMTELGLSARAYDKVRRVALTIADIDDADIILVNHTAEAIQYRLLDRQL